MTNKLATLAIDRESAFLLKCLQGRLRPAAVEEAIALASNFDLDWDKVANRIYRERLGALVYSVVQEDSIVPPAVENNLRQIYLSNALRNTRLLSLVAELLDKFNEAGVHVIVLKGAALAETVYKNVALRPMVDVDILVPSIEVDEALAVLFEMDYGRVGSEPHPGMATEFENELQLRRKGKFDMALELHWSLLDSPYYQDKVDMGWFWQTAGEAKIGFKTGQVLGPEAALLYLCSHITLHHTGEEMLWLHDIAELLAALGDKIDWDEVLTKAKAFDLVIALQQVLNLVNRDWDMQLDGQFLAGLSKLQPSEREVMVVGWMTAADRPVAKRFWADLVTAPDWRSRLRYAWRSLFPTTNYMRQRYQINHAILLPFYYPYRWLVGLLSLFRS
jgi:hypothetical protein